MIFSATIIHLPFYRSAQQSHNKPTVVRDTRQKTKEIALFHCQSNEESTDAVSKKNQACWSKNVIQEQWSCHFGLKWYQTHMGERSKQSKPNYGDTTRRKPCQPFWDKAQGNWPEGREGTHRTLLLGATYTHYSKASQLCLSLQVLLVNMMQGDRGVGDAFWGGYGVLLWLWRSFNLCWKPLAVFWFMWKARGSPLQESKEENVQNRFARKMFVWQCWRRKHMAVMEISVPIKTVA